MTDEWLRPDARVRVMAGPWEGRVGRWVRHDGVLKGVPVSMVKLDDRFSGQSFPTRDLAPE